MGITACGFQEVFLAFVLWHFCRSIWVQVAVSPFSHCIPISISSGFYGILSAMISKHVISLEKLEMDSFRTQTVRIECLVFLGVCFESLNWSNPADITSASQLKWHLRNVYDNIYFSCLIFNVLFSFEFYLSQKIVLLILVMLYDIRISL